MAEQLDLEPAWKRREALEAHLDRIGLKEPLRELLMHLWETGTHDGGQTYRRVSLARLAIELRCSPRGVTNWRDELIAYRFVYTAAPKAGRTLWIVIDWEAVWSCDRIPRTDPEALPKRPDHARHDAPDDAPDDARDHARNDARDHARREPIYIERREEREIDRKTLSFIPSGAQATDAAGLLESLPARAWDDATSDAALYALLRSWWTANLETIQTLGWDAERFTAAVLATRRIKPDLPIQYLAKCIGQPSEKWLAEARRWRAYQKREVPYAAHGTAR